MFINMVMFSTSGVFMHSAVLLQHDLASKQFVIMKNVVSLIVARMESRRRSWTPKPPPSWSASFPLRILVIHLLSLHYFNYRDPVSPPLPPPVSSVSLLSHTYFFSFVVFSLSLLQSLTLNHAPTHSQPPWLLSSCCLFHLRTVFSPHYLAPYPSSTPPLDWLAVPLLCVLLFSFAFVG